MRQDGSSMKIYRDKNRSGKIELSKDVAQKGNFEIQFHPMYGKKVGRYSAGCQGPNNLEAYHEIMSVPIAYDRRTEQHNRYSYALLGLQGNADIILAEILTPLYNAKILTPPEGSLISPSAIA